MKLKKYLRSLLSALLISLLSLSLLTGCSDKELEFAADVLTTILETEVEESTVQEDGNFLEEESTIPEDVFTEEETVIIEEAEDVPSDAILEAQPYISEDGTYTSKEEVAAYLHEYGHLPSNFITKKEAKKLGWISSERNLDEVAPGKSIGGDYFGNYEGNLPETKTRDYYECDIDFDGTYRNGKRIVYSNDGLIYYTEDHYETFELLYGEE